MGAVTSVTACNFCPRLQRNPRQPLVSAICNLVTFFSIREEEEEEERERGEREKRSSTRKNSVTRLQSKKKLCRPRRLWVFLLPSKKLQAVTRRLQHHPPGEIGITTTRNSRQKRRVFLNEQFRETEILSGQIKCLQSPEWSSVTASPSTPNPPAEGVSERTIQRDRIQL